MPSPFAPIPTTGLNLAQQEAVNYMHGPCLVLAGAGSGKTRVITHKIARLIQSGMEPKRIAAITFTNKAATEMRERARSLVGKAAKEVLICTFHALGVRLLRQDGAALGLKPNFSILDSDDVTSILKDCGGSTDAATARQWQWAISRWKNMGLNAAQAQAAAIDDNEKTTARIMARYEERLSAYQSVDFDDLIGLPLKLLQNHAQARQKWQAYVGHVLVDEYQDTNATQYAMLKLLVGACAPKDACFTAVGDDDQSIYGWRGATLDNLKKLPIDFPDLKVVKLEQNYRSTAAILRAANNVIGPNPKLYPKNLWSDLGEGEPVRIVDADHEEHEAERVVARIQSTRAGTGDNVASQAQHKEFRDFAVLYRANHQARVFEQALRKAQIPYKVSGGQSFFDRAEIKDLCAWFRLWVNNNDDPAFLRAVTTPKRGIGHQSLQHLGVFAGKYKLGLFEALFSPSLGLVLPARAVGSLHEFGRYVNDLEFRARHTQGAEAALVFLKDWLQEIDYEKHLYDGEDSQKLAAARWTNVLEFCDWMAARCGGQIDDAAGVSTSSEIKNLLEVAQTISLLSTISERDTDQNVVTLSTLHAAKGLEWPHVMLVGVTEGLLPFKLGDEDNAGGRADGPMSDAGPPQGAKAPSGGSDVRAATSVGVTISDAGPPQGAKAPSGGSDVRAATSVGVTISDAGPPQGAKAPSGGSDVRAATSVGVTISDAGPPQGAKAPSGGSDVRAATSVGVTISENLMERLQEERRLMYVGITRAQRSLAVSWTRKRKKGRDMIAAQPSRFIAEMALNAATVKEDPRVKLKALRAEFAKKAEDAAAVSLAAQPR